MATEQPIFSAQAITAFSIASGIATGAATLFLSSRFAGKRVTTSSVTAAIAVSALATFGAAFLLKEI